MYQAVIVPHDSDNDMCHLYVSCHFHFFNLVPLF